MDLCLSLFFSILAPMCTDQVTETTEVLAMSQPLDVKMIFL
jgi:hypothetical protein